MSIASFLWGTSQFDEAIEKATSEMLPAGSEDIALNLEICDQIRSKTVTANSAMKSLKARVNHKNPNVQLLALTLVDTCIKNGGDAFLAEITAREFIDNLVSILKQPGLNPDVKAKILYYIQNWAIILERKATMGYLGNVYKTLQREGFVFPPRDSTIANDALTETRTAPEWIDSDVCLRCRTAFSFTNRKHHCRNCGQVFDQQCSTKTKTLPHFGITQEVRVCDGCYTALNKFKLSKPHRSHSRSKSSASHRQEISDFDRDLQRALELSLQENRQSSSMPWAASEPPLVDRSIPRPTNDDDDDPDLRAAIEASLREADAPRPSAPPNFTEEDPHAYQPHSPSYYPSINYAPPQKPSFALPNYDLHPTETDAVLSFNQTVEDAHTQGGLTGRHNHNVSELYEKASRVRPKLAMSLDDTDRKQQMLLEMNDKITEVTKLYDHHLNYTLSQPTWRRQATTPYSPQQYPSRVSHAETPAHQDVSNQFQHHPTPSTSQQSPFAPAAQWLGDVQNPRTSQQQQPLQYISESPFQAAPSHPQPVQTTAIPSGQYVGSQSPAATHIYDTPTSVMLPPPASASSQRYSQTTSPVSFNQNQTSTQGYAHPQTSTMPIFPSVPNGEPPNLGNYSYVAQVPERKEALLIDL